MHATSPEDLPGRARYLPVTIIVVTLAVFGAAIGLVSLHLRRTIREQILSRDGDVLNTVALLEQFAAASPDESGGVIEDPMDQLAVVLRSAQLKDVLAVRLYDAAGKFVTAFPPEVTRGQLPAPDLTRLRQLKPASRYHDQARLSDLFVPEPKAGADTNLTVSLLEVVIPIHPKDQARLVGLAQMFLDGSQIRAAFARLDAHLLRHGAAVFALGGLVLSATLGWAFHRLQRANRLLAERTGDLLRANQELTLAAKTSALGAVTAHLIHGLKNPLSGLQNFVASGSQPGGAPEPTDWQDAIATTRRMQSLVNDVVRVLREEDGVRQYEIELPELLEMLLARVGPSAREAEVKLEPECTGRARMTNREANLLVLILENLVRNAIQATPKGKTVRLQAHEAGETLRFEVRDEGPGLPAEVRSGLFTPCRSHKPGGSGIGLALSKQLANQLGADLELINSSARGCAFRLSLRLQATRLAAAPVAPAQQGVEQTGAGL